MGGGDVGGDGWVARDPCIYLVRDNGMKKQRQVYSSFP